MKLCKECKYYFIRLKIHRGDTKEEMCRHPLSLRQLESGYAFFNSCEQTRENSKECGPDAKLFEERNKK